MWKTITEWLGVNKALSITLLLIGAAVGWTFSAHLTHLSDAADMGQRISGHEGRMDGMFEADRLILGEVDEIQELQQDFNAKIADLLARMRTVENEVNRLRDR